MIVNLLGTQMGHKSEIDLQYRNYPITNYHPIQSINLNLNSTDIVAFLEIKVIGIE